MKPNTYTKLYAHCIFATKGRESLLNDSISDRIHKYIYGIIKEKRCFPIAINGTRDHIHLIIGFPPTINISDLVRDIKRSSSLYINQITQSYLKFKWQEGFGAFTVGHRDLDRVYKYVLNQDLYHKEQPFSEEYKNLLKDEGVDFKTDYLFEFNEED